MSAADNYRAWVACLGCYSNGHLAGDWFDADNIPDSMNDWQEVVGNAYLTDLHISEGHEELWVMDHEGGVRSGEYGLVEAQQEAELMGRVDDWELDVFRAWIKYHGIEAPDESDLEDAREAWQGEHQSDEEFAECFADELGLVNPDATWPNSYIDWDLAARDLMMDYFEESGHYFRHI